MIISVVKALEKILSTIHVLEIEKSPHSIAWARHWPKILSLTGKTMHEKNFTAIILAAGYSRRMGQCKPLLKLSEQTMLEVVVATFIKAGISDIRVVVGHDMELLTPILEKLGTRIIINDHYNDGMFSSVLVALDSMESNVEAFFLLPVDIPLVRPWTIKYLIENASIHEKKYCFHLLWVDVGIHR